VLNVQLGGNFDPDQFTHVALWNEEEQWIEMRLQAGEAAEVTLEDAGISVNLAKGEDILTEISAKFTPVRIEEELGAAGFVIDGMWGAEEGEFLLTLAHPFC
jgi:L-histidine N-alpha-methyltransferase